MKSTVESIQLNNFDHGAPAGIVVTAHDSNIAFSIRRNTLIAIVAVLGRARLVHDWFMHPLQQKTMPTFGGARAVDRGGTRIGGIAPEIGAGGGQPLPQPQPQTGCHARNGMRMPYPAAGRQCRRRDMCWSCAAGRLYGDRDCRRTRHRATCRHRATPRRPATMHRRCRWAEDMIVRHAMRGT